MSNTVKKYFSILLTIFLIFSNFSGIRVKAASDEVNKSISIQVDKSQVNPNEEVTISLSSSLGNNDIDKMLVHYETPGNKYVDSLASFNEVTGKFEAKLPITEYTESGLWKEVGLHVYYKNGYTDEILGSDADFSAGNFTVINENSLEDNGEPAINGISVDKTDAAPGEVVKVSVDATDDLSGVGVVRLIYDRSAGSGKTVFATLNKQTNKYEANISLPEYEKEGVWTLDEVYVEDYSGNFYTNYNNDELNSGNFTVHNENSDNEAPVLNGVTVDKQEASSGDTITWSLDVTDNQSGVDNVWVQIKNTESYEYDYKTATYNDQTKKYDVTMKIDDSTSLGKWGIQYVNLTDIAGNTADVEDSSYSWGTFDFSKTDVNVVSKPGDIVDTTPPVVNSVSVDKTEVKPGETVTVSVDAEDDVSGINKITIDYYNENGSMGYLSKEAVLNSATGKYEAKFTISDDAQPGDFVLDTIYVEDNKGNGDYIYGSDVNFDSAKFTVINDAFDGEPPVINSVTVDKRDVKPGDTVTVSLDVSDNLSGVKSVVVDYQNEDLGFISENANYNEATGKYEAKFPIDYFTRPGKWKIGSVDVSDNKGNSLHYYDEDIINYDNASFTVTNAGFDDMSPPVINSVSVDKTEAGPGDTVTVSVDAQDDQSGVKSVFVYLENENYNIYSGNATYNEETGKYDLEIPINYLIRTGNWRISYINVNDNTGNARTYYNGWDGDFSAANFSVVNDLADITPPTIAGVSVDTAEVHPGETATISIDAQDDKSGVDKVYVYGGSSNISYSDWATYNEDTKKYEIKIPVTETTLPGAWGIYYIDVYDKAGNERTYYNGYYGSDFSAASFTIVNDLIDIAGPTISGVSVDKKVANPGETVTISIDAKDDKSGIDSIYVDLAGDYDSTGGFATYNEETQKYELKIPITETTYPGTWRISLIDMYDKAGNRMYYHSVDYDYSAANFTVVNDQVDITPPTVSGVSVDKKVAKPGDTVTISVDVTDDKSGVDRVWVNAVGNYDSYGNWAIYNQDTKKYELKIPIYDTTNPGSWSINWIDVYDKSGNYGYYYTGYDGSDFSAANFTVENDLIDLAPPTITGVSVDKKEANPGDTVTISIAAADDKSGIDKITVGIDSNYDYVYNDAIYNEETNMYEIKIPVTEKTKPGLRSIDYIYVIDKAGNRWTYYNGYGDADFSTANYTVINDNADVTPPTVQNITVDKKEAQPGGTVKVSMDVTDDKSSVSSVHIGFTGSHGGYMDAEAVYNSETQKYEAEFSIADYTRPGIWRVNSIYVIDSESNANYSYPESGAYPDATFTVINDNIDVTPPVINSVSVNKTEAHPGDVITLSIDASDQSGISFMRVYYEMGYKYLSQNAVYNSETGMYEVKFSITDSSRPGAFSIDSIYLEDNEYNETEIYNGENGIDFSAANFTVINENADITPPTIQEVTVDKTNAVPGDTVKIIISASDDKSGIDYVNVDLENSYYGYFSGNAVYNADTDKYELSVPITDGTKPGLWSINGISIGDKEGNSKYYENGYDGNDFTAANYTVTNEKADIAPPTIIDVSVDKKEATPNDTVTLSINAADDKSGVAEVIVYLNNRYGGYSADAIYNTSTNKYELQIPITDKTKPGLWSIDYIRVNDFDGNTGYYYSSYIDYSDANFTVINENADVTPPIIQEVTVDKKDAVPGDTVKISISATDDKSGIDYVNVDLENIYYGYFNNVATFNPATSKYEVTVPITDQTKPGQWSIDGIQIGDKEGNNKYYENGYDGNNFSGANFTVTNDKADITPPTITDVRVDKNEAIPGNTVTLSMNASDDKSGVNEIKANLTNRYGGNYSGNLTYNQSTNRYELQIPVTDKTKPGLWSIDYIRVNDKDGNYGFYYSDSVDYSNANYTVTNENADITPPTIQEVAVDQTDAIPGDNVKISIGASDDKSGISYVNVELKNSYYGYFSGEAIYNAQTQKYELSVPVTYKTKPGLWSISGISISDREDNYKYYENGYDGNDFSAANFSVTNDAADITPPTISDVKVDKTDAQPGDEVTVSLNAVDNQNRVDTVQVNLTNNYGGYYHGYATYNQSTNRYEMQFQVDDTTNSGEWSIDYIRVNDLEGNYGYYYSDSVDFSNAVFTVTNDNFDTAPPVINSVTLDKQDVQIGDDITAIIDATDASGIGRITLEFVDDRGSETWQTADYNEVTQKYEAKFHIESFLETGTWHLNYLYAGDSIGNGKEYQSEFSNLTFNVVKNQDDITPPVLNSISVDKTEVTPGQNVTVSVDAQDPAGVDSVWVTYQNNAGDYRNFEAVYNEDTSKYDGTFSVSDTTYPGKWTINSVYLRDSKGNGISISPPEFDFSSAEFTVINDNLDVDAPTVESVSVDKKDVKPGEDVTVSVDAKDDKSGIKEVSIDFVVPNRHSTKTVIAKLNPLTGKYEAKLSMSNFAASGKWMIRDINLEDEQGNEKYVINSKLAYYYADELMDLSNADFTVTNPNEDSTAPVVNSINVNRSQFIPGETATIQLDVQDSQSGVDSIWVGYKGSNGGYYEQEAIFNEETQKYEINIPITDRTKPGTWNVDYVSVIDHEGNEEYLFEGQYDFSAGSFSVINDSLDITAPTFNGISVDSKEANPGETVTVSLDVSDAQSGVSEVSVSYQNSNGGYAWYMAEWNEETNRYEFTIPITDKTKPGTWKVSDIYVSDNEGNDRDIYNTDDIDLSNGEFTVINNSQADFTLPEFHGISVNQKEGKSGDNIVLSIDAMDAGSGIDRVNIRLVAFNGGEIETRAYFNEDTQKYEATIPISDYTIPGTWFVGDVVIIDNEDNELHLERRDHEELGNADFTVINDEIDYQPPVIHSYSVDKKTVSHGQEVVLSAEVTDDQSGVGGVYATYKNTDGSTFSKTLTYNDATGKYEVKMLISPLFKQGTWSLDSITAYDMNENGIRLDNGEFDDLSEGNFTVTDEDVTPPQAPVVDDVTDQSTEVAGSTEANAKVTVKIGSDEYGGTADENGNFTIEIPKQVAGTAITVIATDAAGNESIGTIVIVEDVTVPEAPQVDRITDQTTVVTGTTEPGATVTVHIRWDDYSAKADANGHYSVTIPVQEAGMEIWVTAKDAVGNESERTTVFVEDVTAPDAPQVGDVFDNSTEVSGYTEAKAKVTVKIGSEEYVGSADEIGSFTISIPKQNAGTTILVTATDAAGNVSDSSSVSVKDGTAPEAPTVNKVSDKSTEVTGTTEPGATVTVHIWWDEYSAKADATGHYSVTIPVQETGTEIRVTAKDVAGNESAATTVYVEDGTAPEAPVVDGVTEYSTEVTGVTEANAEVTVKIGSDVYTGNADENGNFMISIPEQQAGTVITVYAADKAGNISEGTVVTVEDVTAPEAPMVDSITDQSTEVTGLTEPGAVVTVQIGSDEYTANADENGNFSISIPVQAAGTEVIVIATDAAGNNSDATTIYVDDVTAPEAPVVESITDQSTEVIGTTEPGATVTVQIDSDEYTDTADEDGNFDITIPVQAAGTEVVVFATDEEGNISDATILYVDDVTAPDAPQVESISDQSTNVIGMTEPGALVTVQIGAEEYTDTADEEGNFDITIPAQEAGTEITVYVTDEAGNVSESTIVIVEDLTAPDAPQVDEVTDQSTKVTGSTEPGVMVTVEIGSRTYQDTADDKGNFSVTIPNQKAGTVINVFVTDAAKNDSEETTITVKDVTPPLLSVSSVTDKSTTITGTTEVGASVTVTIGTKKYTATVDSKGNYKATITVQKAGTKVTVTAKDTAGNITEKSVTVVDTTAPSIPTVNTVSDLTTKITGTTEAGAAVTVTIGTKPYSATADSKGSFAVTIPAQKAGTKLTVTATDAAGNTSSAITITVVDKTAPSAPSVNTVSDKSKEVTGTAEAGSTITVAIGTKKYTGKADTKGTYKVIITAQKAGTKISVTTRDAAGNTSSATTITVIDKTAPSTPTVNTVTDQSKEVTGKAEAGSTITVTIGTKKYTNTTDSKGNFKVSIPLQKAGTKMSVTATDAGGNISSAKAITVIDKTPPAAPKVNTVKSSKSMVVTGTAEAYATITIKVGSTVVGTGKADKYGKYSIKIKTQKRNTTLSITAADAAKNVSKATTVKVQ